jgi:hypothetical protein
MVTATTRGPRVFVSHASADGKYVKSFVEDILLRGAELRSADVFYSSAADMGVKSGEHLMERVRAEAGGSELIVAMVTPMYQTRPVCVAELGAAWARGVLFPVLAPGMSRSELEGVLPGLLIKPADDESVLDELADRIRDLGFRFSLASFGEGKANWKSDLRGGVSPASLPPVPSADEVSRLQQELRNTQTALDSAKRELDEQRQRNDRLRAAKTAAETREADLPTDEYERFEALLTGTKNAVAELGGFAGANDVVVDAVWHNTAGQQMYLPSNFEDPDRHDSISAEVKNGRLIFDEDTGEISPNADFPAVAHTRDAVVELTDYLDPALRSEAFLEWFSQQYGTPMDLRMKACWDVVI